MYRRILDLILPLCLPAPTPHIVHIVTYRHYTQRKDNDLLSKMHETLERCEDLLTNLHIPDGLGYSLLLVNHIKPVVQ